MKVSSRTYRVTIAVPGESRNGSCPVRHACLDRNRELITAVSDRPEKGAALSLTKLASQPAHQERLLIGS